MGSSKVETLFDRETPASGQAPEGETKSRGYRAPELRVVGAVEQIKGSGDYRDRDLTNDKCYI